jgi:hypothetical protein
MGKEFDIEKLNGNDNYHTWTFQMQAYLTCKQLDGCISDPVKEEKPEKLANCLAILTLNVDKKLYVHIRKCKTPKEVWETFKRLFEEKGLSRKIGLLKGLISTKLDTSMQQYIDTLMDYSNKLGGIGFEISDDWLSAIILAGLTDDYKPFIMAIEASGTNVTSDVIVTKLLDSPSSSTEAGAFFGNKKEFNKKAKNGKRCFTCGSRGHFSNTCEKKTAKEKTAKAKTAFTAFHNKNNHENKHINWYVDSGASNHMTPCKEMLTNIKQSNVENIISANNAKLVVKNAGEVLMQTNKSEIKIDDVLYVPNLAANLLSVNKIVKKGNSVVFDKNGCTIMNGENDIVACCKPENGVYKLNGKCFATVRQEDAFLWHRKLGHSSLNKMLKMRDGLKNIIFDDSAKNKIKNCVICAKGKQSRLPFKSKDNEHSKNLLDLIHSDLMGPMENESIGGARYILSFIDDHSKKVFVYFLKQKSEVSERFADFLNVIETQTGRKVKTLRSDNGTEYVNNKMKQQMQKKGIIHQKSVIYSPQQNGTAERMNRTLIEKAKCLLFDAGLPKKFWAEAVNQSAFLINKIIASATGKTPDEIFFGRNHMKLSDLKLFGSKVTVHVPKEKRKKLDQKAEEMIFIGYDNESPGYRCIDVRTHKLVISRDVKFLNEDAEPVLNEDEQPTDDEHILNEEEQSTDDEHIPNEEEQSTDDEDASPHESSHEESEHEPERTVAQTVDTHVDEQEDDYEPDDTGDPDYEPDVTIINNNIPRATRSRAKPHPFDLNYFAFYTEPDSLKSALEDGSDGRKWKTAMEEEIKSHQLNNTWVLDDLPPGRKAIKAKWVFKKKINEAGEVARYKARLVAKGCSQKFGLDYNETFSPVVRHSSVRLLMALAIKNKMKIHQMDVVTAYLQSNLSELIYMEQPEGYNDGSSKVCRLKKSIYGLKQAGKNWNEKLDAELKMFGLLKSKLDPCVYYEKDRSIFMAIYVDDFLIFYKDAKFLVKLKSYLQEKFNMKDLGPAKGCLGIRINATENTVELDQTAYILEILRKFGMEDSKPVGTPSDTNKKLATSDVNAKNDLTGKIPYQEAVGSLLYLAQCTRPDIAFAVNDVSRFNGKHSEAHWAAVKRIFRYLKGTVNLKLIFSNRKLDGLQVFSDADWGSDPDKRRSCSGIVVKLSGGAISWSSKRQPIVALSSTEAEYIALSSAVCESIWIKQLMDELDKTFADRIKIYCDNQSSIKLAESDAFRPRTKHIDIRYHNIRDYVKKGVIDISYVPTEKMTADSLTKSVAKEKTIFCRKNMGLA